VLDQGVTQIQIVPFLRRFMIDSMIEGPNSLLVLIITLSQQIKDLAVASLACQRLVHRFASRQHALRLR